MSKSVHNEIQRLRYATAEVVSCPARARLPARRWHVGSGDETTAEGSGNKSIASNPGFPFRIWSRIRNGKPGFEANKSIGSYLSYTRVHNPKNFSSYNVPKVTGSTTYQVLISDRTVTFSKSSSLRDKRACKCWQKCPPTQKIGITCFLRCAVQK